MPFIDRRSIYRPLLISLSILCGLLLGRMTGHTWFGRFSHSDTHFGSGFPQPATAHALVQHPNMIVVATVGLIAQHGPFDGYDAAGKPIALASGFDPRAMPFVDYPLVIEQLIKA